MELAAGTVLERYTVERTLGAGGMAVVYLARHNQIGSLHAVKVLTVHGAVIRERLLQEGRVQAGLKHANIVTVTDLVEVDGAPALVLEYVRGPTMADLVRQTPLSLGQVDALGRGVLRGVAAAHRQGLVHRDLKPQNVLIAVNDDGLVPKIADFGLGKLVRSTAPSNTRSGATMGTPAYMAPEQIRDSATVDERADVFALGAILYELLTGRLAFGGGDTLETFERIARGQYEPLDAFVESCPTRMRVTIERALEVDAADRFADAAEMLESWTGHAAGLDAEPISSEDPWSAELIEVAESLAPSGAESLDSVGRTPRTPASGQDTFALSLNDGSVPPVDPASSVGGVESLSDRPPEPYEVADVAWAAGLAAVIALPIGFGSVSAVTGVVNWLGITGVVGIAELVSTLVGAAMLGALAVLWRTGRVSRHHWWLGAPAAVATLGNLGTGVGALSAMDAVAGKPLAEAAAASANYSATALSTELAATTLAAILMLATTDTAALLVTLDRGEVGKLSRRRLAILLLALGLGTAMWAATLLWLMEGAVPFVVFLILLGASTGMALVSFDAPDPSVRRGEMRILVFVTGPLGVLAAAKVVWLQQMIGLLASVDAGGGLTAAAEFADGMASNGLSLVVGWGAAIVAIALVAATGAGRPRVPANKIMADIGGLTLILGALIGSKVWADHHISMLTGEVVPGFLGAESEARLGVVFTDRELMEHRARVPTVLDPAFDAHERWRSRGEEIPQAGAIVVDAGRSGLRMDDLVIAVDGTRVATVRELLGVVMNCDCEAVELTVDRKGQLSTASLPVHPPGG